MSNEPIKQAVDRARYDFSLRLAQEIRRVDGGHDLSASALADALLPFLEASFSPLAVAPSPVVMPEGVLKALRHADSLSESYSKSTNASPTPTENHLSTLVAYIRSLSSPAPVEELPERATEAEREVGEVGHYYHVTYRFVNGFGSYTSGFKYPITTTSDVELMQKWVEENVPDVKGHTPVVITGWIPLPGEAARLSRLEREAKGE